MMTIKNDELIALYFRDFIDGETRELIKAHTQIQQQHRENHAIDNRRGEQVNRAIA
jgi:hypothetical protein